MITTNNEKFNNFIQNKDERYYTEKSKDSYNYYFIKIPYDGDARMHEITLITHGKKELYNKAVFEQTLINKETA